MTKRDQKWLARAVRVAEQSTCRQRHGAVLVKGNRVLAVAVNRFRNHPSNVSNPKTDATVHAEVAVVSAVGSVEAHGATVYVARVNKAGYPVLSKPCGRCQDWLDAIGVKAVWT